jgi:diguanylate cyclase
MPEPFINIPWLRKLQILRGRFGSPLVLFGMVLCCTAFALATTAWVSWLLAAPITAEPLWAAGLSSALVASVFGAALMRLLKHSRAMALAHDQVSLSDPTTGSLSRRGFLDLADREWARCRRYGQDGALLLVDVDHFKTVLANQGTECVEALMRQSAKAVSSGLRTSDVMGRTADDQFALFLPNTDPMGALDVAERIREQVARQVLRWDDNGVATTVSVGVASVGVAHTALETLLHDTNNALDAARTAGRNCVRAAPVQPRAVPPRVQPSLPNVPKGNERPR